jgi:hypothetical protein
MANKQGRLLRLKKRKRIRGNERISGGEHGFWMGGARKLGAVRVTSIGSRTGGAWLYSEVDEALVPVTRRSSLGGIVVRDAIREEWRRSSSPGVFAHVRIQMAIRDDQGL